jgi:hypothetical protein
MKTKTFVRTVLIVGALVCVTASLARADKLDLQAGLSKNAKIELNDVTIAEALDKIGKKAGVKFVLSDEAAWKLPYGEATRLSLALDGPLAESLTEMLNTFFMRYVVWDNEVMIYPREELEHIIGRPSARQLTILRKVYTSTIQNYLGDQPQETVNVGLGREIIILPITVQQQINDLLRQLAGKDPIYTWKRGRKEKFEKIVTRTEGNKNFRIQVETVPDDKTVFLPTAVTLVQLLSQVGVENHDPQYTRWYIGGTEFAEQVPEIRVVGIETFAELNLNQKVDISYENYPADKILGELASRAGIELEIQPQEYLNEYKQYKLSVEMKNTTIEQAFRNITGMIEIESEYKIYDSRLVIDVLIEDNTPETKASTAAERGPVTRPTTRRPSGGGDYVGKISIPMDEGEYFIEFMLRESDLTEELKALRAEKMKAIVGNKESDE